MMRKAFNDRGVRTSGAGTDPPPGGRTYAIPFGAVWEAALQLVSGGLRGWTAVSADDRSGIIEARVRKVVWPFPASAVISVSLDANAQTRVDVTTRSHRRHGSLRASARRGRRFIRALDKSLATRAGQGADARFAEPG